MEQDRGFEGEIGDEGDDDDSFFFGSDEVEDQDESGESSKGDGSHKKNEDCDDPFYDEREDERRQEGMDYLRWRQRHGFKGMTKEMWKKMTSKKKKGTRKQEDANADPEAETTDAILSCPGCFTTLCIDCQRHSRYSDQYRALFVQNCKIDHDHAECVDRRGDIEDTKEGDADKSLDDGGVLYPVQCTVCGAEVGLVDAEGVYHFFGVLASNG
eukprot:TRINITY_DN24481_c0_g1_i1.p1 TRINITY_DN24481_c0_g1~~TRINITY_DN24481_c0_g1_i1.p1  ORF type:complete len:226 (+),score=65.06 TRINITY_DN24481_c0_g1_i1:40-678(+)